MPKQRKVFFFISAITVLVGIIFLFSDYYLAQNHLKERLSRDSKSLKTALEVTLQDSLTHLQLLASVFANDTRIQELMLLGRQALEAEGGGSGGDRTDAYREALYQYTKARWTDVMQKQGIAQLHFHFAPGALSFLRVHQRERYGDKLNDSRFTVVDTNTARKPHGGFEVGRSGAALRSVVPVFATTNEGERRHVGALEIGLNPQQLLVSFDQTMDAGIAILLEQSHLAALLWPTLLQRNLHNKYQTPCGCVVDASSRPYLSAISEQAAGDDNRHPRRNGQPKLLHIGSKTYVATFFPLRDYLGENEPTRPDIGSILIWRDITDVFAQFQDARWFNLFYALLAFILFEIILFFSLRGTLRHLERAVNEQAVALQRGERKFRNMVESLRQDYFLYERDNAGRFTYVSPSVSAVLGYRQEEFLRAPFHWPSAEDEEELRQEACCLQREINLVRKDGAMRLLAVNETPVLDADQHQIGWDGIAHDITESRYAEQLLRGRENIMEMVTRGAALQGILDALARYVESLRSEIHCSILLLDDTGKRLLLGAAPSLPSFYNQAINGLLIGPGVGSCGTAAYTGKRVIIDDILTHPYWQSFVELVSKTPLRACWAEPFKAPGERVLGTFALYYETVRQPDAKDLELIKWGAELAALVVERARSAQALSAAEERSRLLLESTNEGIFGLDRDGKMTFINPAAAQMLGYSQQELLGQDAHSLLHYAQEDGSPLDKQHCQILYSLHNNVGLYNQQTHFWHKNRHSIPIEYRSMPLRRKQKSIGVVVSFHDIGERKKNEQRMERLAFFDALTGLSNRPSFLDKLQQARAHFQRKPSGFALHFLDLDHFKDINDTLGHPVGDALLREVAQRLKTLVRGGDTVARFGGDEFAILQQDVEAPLSAGLLAERIIDTLSKPIELEGHRIHSNVSIGIVLYQGQQEDVQTLLKQADAALYAAKNAGRGKYSLHTDAMTQALKKEIQLTEDIKQALSDQQFFIEYQPQFDLHSGALVGVEAFARWEHPALGSIPPGTFIPLAEKRGLIRALGLWLTRQICAQARQWLDAGYEFGRLASNLSNLQLRDGGFARHFLTIMKSAGVEARYLELDLREALLLENSSVYRRQIKILGDAGLQFAVDDFGSGFSSLIYLKQFAIGKLKIDSQFISRLHRGNEDENIVAAMIALAHGLNFIPVAEGVETQAQADTLRRLGCRHAQGFLYSAPLSAAELERRYLSKERKTANTVGQSHQITQPKALLNSIHPMRH